MASVPRVVETAPAGCPADGDEDSFDPDANARAAAARSSDPVKTALHLMCVYPLRFFW